jgi:hypothetical protein
VRELEEQRVKELEKREREESERDKTSDKDANLENK